MQRHYGRFGRGCHGGGRSIAANAVASAGQFGQHGCPMNAVATAKHRRLRTLVEGCVWLLLAAVALETWLLAGVAVPCRVVGGSMAETLRGTHREIVCADCGFRFACGVDGPRPPPRAVCPNCGYAANDLQTPPDARRRPAADRPRGLLASLAAAMGNRRPRHPRRADEILVSASSVCRASRSKSATATCMPTGKSSERTWRNSANWRSWCTMPTVRPTLEPAIPPRWRPERRESRWNSAADGFQVSRMTPAPKASRSTGSCTIMGTGWR